MAIFTHTTKSLLRLRFGCCCCCNTTQHKPTQTHMHTHESTKLLYSWRRRFMAPSAPLFAEIVCRLFLECPLGPPGLRSAEDLLGFENETCMQMGRLACVRVYTLVWASTVVATDAIDTADTVDRAHIADIIAQRMRVCCACPALRTRVPACMHVVCACLYGRLHAPTGMPICIPIHMPYTRARVRACADQNAKLILVEQFFDLVVVR